MSQRLGDVPLAELVPEIGLWNNGCGISLDLWIRCVANIEHAIGFGELFWPDFVEHDGCVLFAGFSEESFLGFMRQTGGDRRRVEVVMNHRHILDLFGGHDSSPTRSQIVYLGRLLKEMWSAKLQRDFLGKRCVVSFSDEPSEDLLGYEVTFFQGRE